MNVNNVIVCVENVCEEKTMLFRVPSYMKNHAHSVLVSLYNEWNLNDIKYNCGFWIEENAEARGVQCEFVQYKKWSEKEK